jgi:DNA-binding CsgD family transcriptional regulator
MQAAPALPFLSESLTRDFTAAIDVAPNMNVAMDMLMDVVRILGFPMVCYSYMPTTRLSDGRWVPPPLLTRGYPPGWDAAWDRHRCNDPYYHACFDGSLAIDWSAIQVREDLTSQERDSWHYLADKQLHKGVTVPIHLPGRRFAFVSVLSDAGDGEWNDLLRTTKETLFVVAHHFHTASFHRFQNPFPQRRACDLSARELECLKWAAHGKTADEIASIIDRSVETVRVHLKRAGVKLDASNRAHAVAKACYMGLIEFPR